MVSYQEQKRIDRRIAQKDANFWIMNASKAAAEILAAQIQVGFLKSEDMTLPEFERVRDAIIESNLVKSEELQSAGSTDGEDTEPSKIPF